MHIGEATNKFSLMLGITSNIRVQKAHFLAIRCTGMKLHGDEGVETNCSLGVVD